MRTNISEVGKSVSWAPGNSAKTQSLLAQLARPDKGLTEENFDLIRKCIIAAVSREQNSGSDDAKERGGMNYRAGNKHGVLENDAWQRACDKAIEAKDAASLEQKVLLAVMAIPEDIAGAFSEKQFLQKEHIPCYNVVFNKLMEWAAQFNPWHLHDFRTRAGSGGALHLAEHPERQMQVMLRIGGSRSAFSLRAGDTIDSFLFDAGIAVSLHTAVSMGTSRIPKDVTIGQHVCRPLRSIAPSSTASTASK